MIDHAVIVAPLNTALIWQGERVHALRAGSGHTLHPLRRDELGLILDSGAEVMVLSGHGLTVQSVARALNARAEGHEALLMLLKVLDRVLDDETRGLAAEAAEPMLARRGARDFVLNRLLGLPLPAREADLDGARTLASAGGFARVGEALDELAKVLPVLPVVAAAWRDVAADLFPHVEIDKAHRLFVDLGIFAQCARGLAAGNAGLIHRIIFDFSRHADLVPVLPQPAKILLSLAAKVARHRQPPSRPDRHEEEGEHDAAGAAENTLVDDPILALIEAAGSEMPQGKARQTKPQKVSAVDARHKAESQKKAIIDALINERQAHAERLLHGLVEYQLRHGGRQYLSKSLSSLATQAREHHWFDQALRFDTYAVAANPDDPFACTGRAETLRALGRLDEALDAYDRTVARFPGDPVAGNGRAETLRALGRLDEALDAYDQTVARFPGDPFACNGRAETLRALGRLDETLDAYDRTVARFPGDPFACTGRAETLRALGRLDEALASYRNTIRRFPNNRPARNALACLLIENDQHDEARSLLPVSAPRSWQDWIDFHVRAMSHLREGSFVEALPYLRQGADDCPFADSKPYFRTALALAEIQNQHLTEAEALLTVDLPMSLAALRAPNAILLGHILAARAERERAVALLKSAQASPVVDAVREALFRFYGLDGKRAPAPGTDESQELQRQIAEGEFRLVFQIHRQTMFYRSEA